MQLLFPAVATVIVTNVSVTPMFVNCRLASDFLKAERGGNKITLLPVLFYAEVYPEQERALLVSRAKKARKPFPLFRYLVKSSLQAEGCV